MFMVDLFSGRGGASKVMRERGWRVLTVDIDPSFRPDVVADIRKLPLRLGARPDLLWASPPCTEFSRKSMPPSWFPDAPEPDLSCIEATWAAVHALRPKFWIMENVRGAIPYLGRPRLFVQPIALWGEFPPLQIRRRWIPKYYRRHYTAGAYDPSLRAEIPEDLSWAVASAIEAWT